MIGITFFQAKNYKKTSFFPSDSCWRLTSNYVILSQTSWNWWAGTSSTKIVWSCFFPIGIVVQVSKNFTNGQFKDFDLITNPSGNYKFCHVHMLPTWQPALVKGPYLLEFLWAPTNNQDGQILYITKNAAKITQYKVHPSNPRFGQIFSSRSIIFPQMLSSFYPLIPSTLFTLKF